MPKLLEAVCSAALGKYRDFGFILYEENDHIVILEHCLCGFKDKFVSTSVTIEALQNDCFDHLVRVHNYNEGSPQD